MVPNCTRRVPIAGQRVNPHPAAQGTESSTDAHHQHPQNEKTIRGTEQPLRAAQSSVVDKSLNPRMEIPLGCSCCSVLCSHPPVITVPSLFAAL